METFNVIDCQLTDRLLVLTCKGDKTIRAERTNAQFLLNKWDKKGDLVFEIPSWELQKPDIANIPAAVMKRLAILVQGA